MVAERVEHQLYSANVSGGEREAVWKNGIGNFRSGNFSTLINVLKFSMALIAVVDSLHDPYKGVKNMLGRAA